MRVLDLETWKRREHYEFFRRFDDPFWNVTVPVDVTGLVDVCRDDGPSFFLASLWTAMRALNETEELRMRIRGDDVVVHDVTHPACTVLLEDETFVFAYFDMHERFETFRANADALLQRLRRADPGLDPQPERDDVVYCSVLPWLGFSSFRHARAGEPDSIPRLVLGRHTAVGGRRSMPLSIEAHHALVDGLHVGRFVASLESRLATPLS